MSGMMDGYVDVAERIVEFRAKHPDGSLQPANLDQPYTVQDIGGQTFIVVVAAAYRDKDDQRPGIGMAYEVFPGKTNFTRGSELQNAETSAWGRAIVATLAADTKRGVSSAEEVRNRQAEREQPLPEPSEADQLRTQIHAHCRDNKIDPRSVAEQFQAEHGQNIRTADADSLRKYLAALRDGVTPSEPEAEATQ